MAALAAGARTSLRRVINATGVILHTNLGRAPLAAEAIAHAAAVAGGYSNLEYDLATGGRGHRHAHTERLIVQLTGAGAAAVVNNNAAATLVILSALAAGREVIVSRGELVEIGGGFRVPEILAQSGAVLREVGTTNRTRAIDYLAAASARTALILRVHPSNFHVSGFTERPGIPELADVARRANVPLVEDLGSGWLGLEDEVVPALAGEPSVRADLAAGVDVVAVSGDKLLGGPQAGIIAGRADLVQQIRRHPLMRACRADKLIHAALEATLLLWAESPSRGAIPIRRMMALTSGEIERRALAIVPAVGTARVRAEIIDGVSTIGGGAGPNVTWPTRLIAIDAAGLSPNALEARLRAQDPPVIARIQDDRVVIDLRTVPAEDDAALADAIRAASAP